MTLNTSAQYLSPDDLSCGFRLGLAEEQMPNSTYLVVSRSCPILSKETAKYQTALRSICAPAVPSLRCYFLPSQQSLVSKCEDVVESRQNRFSFRGLASFPLFLFIVLLSLQRETSCQSRISSTFFSALLSEHRPLAYTAFSSRNICCPPNYKVQSL